jgi:hypothetical protein
MARSQQGNPEKSISQLIKELRDDLVLLVRQEIALVKTEVAEKVAMLKHNGMLIGVAAAAGYLGTLALGLAACAGLTALLIVAGLPVLVAVWLAPLILGVAACIVAAVCIAAVMRARTTETIASSKTVQSLREAA